MSKMGLPPRAGVAGKQVLGGPPAIWMVGPHWSLPGGGVARGEAVLRRGVMMEMRKKVEYMAVAVEEEQRNA